VTVFVKAVSIVNKIKNRETQVSAAYPYGMMNFIPALATLFQTANSCTRWRGIFKGSHRMGDGRIFLKTLAPFCLAVFFLSREHGTSYIPVASMDV
jgi:hypothetical protein